MPDVNDGPQPGLYALAETQGFDEFMIWVRDRADASSVPVILHTAGAMIEHAAYVSARHSGNAPVTRLMLLASELEGYARDWAEVP